MDEHLFKPGNKVAEKWTEEVVLPKLEAMYTDLEMDDIVGVPAKNAVKANDIKTLGEICLMHDVTYNEWEYWKRKFTEAESEKVFRMLQKIEWILENRMVYSGTFMDIFVLKNKYGYRDKHDVDHTSKGEKMSQPAPISPLATDGSVLKIQIVDGDGTTAK